MGREMFLFRIANGAVPAGFVFRVGHTIPSFFVVFAAEVTANLSSPSRLMAMYSPSIHEHVTHE
jgi:hypothetical protein